MTNRPGDDWPTSNPDCAECKGKGITANGVSLCWCWMCYPPAVPAPMVIDELHREITPGERAMYEKLRAEVDYSTFKQERDGDWPPLDLTPMFEGKPSSLRRYINDEPFFSKLRVVPGSWKRDGNEWSCQLERVADDEPGS